MNYKLIGKIISEILFGEIIFMIPAMILCFADGRHEAGAAFIISMSVIVVISGVTYLLSRNAKNSLGAKDGFVCVGLAWIILSLTGCLPFFISGEIPSYIDALFETVSGFTTTGASILTDIESLSRGMLYWRSFSHWLGGMGVLVFLLAIVPLSKKDSGYMLHLLRSESPGPDVGKIVPKMKHTAMILYLMYFALTAADFIFLVLGRMPVFDAICTAFGTAGTGGFGIRSDSIAGYSPYIQVVCTVFMLLFGVNFNCYYLIVSGQFKNLLKNEELRLYFGIFFGAVILITVNTVGYFQTMGEAIRHVSFQVSSIMTTTGFCTVDFDLWPSFSKSIIVCLMVIGASAGSTGGGFKCSRMLLLVKSLRRSIRRMLHPQKIQSIRADGQSVDEKIVENANNYLIAYVFIIIISYLLISIDGFSSTTNFTAVLSCLNNIGPGLDTVGPVGNFSGFGPISKIILIFDMLAGRLEIFPILVLFSTSAWSRTGK